MDCPEASGHLMQRFSARRRHTVGRLNASWTQYLATYLRQTSSEEWVSDGLVSYAEAVLTARPLSASRVDCEGWSSTAADSSVTAVSAVTSLSASLWARAPAATLDRRCSTELVPGMATTTGERRSSQASAIWAPVAPRRRAGT